MNQNFLFNKNYPSLIKWILVSPQLNNRDIITTIFFIFLHTQIMFGKKSQIPAKLSLDVTS